jgi:diacylglycerol diphosphate phosphatase/phosphatidate phosphatase
MGSDCFGSMQSFPSGHTSSSFAAGIFLTFYLNAKLKTFADHTSQFWTFIVTIAPLLGASLIAGSMYVSHVSTLLVFIFQYL